MDRLIGLLAETANPLTRLADAFVARLIPEVEANADCRWVRFCGCCSNHRGNSYCVAPGWPGRCVQTCNGYGC
jgi:hypothetical protein